MVIEEIVQNNEGWARSCVEKDARYFEKLSAPQKPCALYIGCCDSRVVPEAFMGFAPGEVFVHRNIANVVSAADDNAMSVVQYAVEHLGVAHIIVCGHYGCGGVQAAAARAGAKTKPTTALNAWIEPIVRLCERYKETLMAIPDEEARHKQLVRMHLETQCQNVDALPVIKKARVQRDVVVHGVVFDMNSGLLERVATLS